ncbi:MAG: GNAT family N-acetyltransferase [Candidatus Dormibacteraeota bacterium]|nr:GNAT family N-acetyltransferase [Candidatus Dormibacteraeota bacterium]
MNESDAELRVRLETDPVVMRYLGGPREADDIRRVHASSIVEAKRGECWACKVMIDESDQPAGTIALFPSTHHGEPIYEVGWIIDPAWQGRGVASIALQTLLDRARRARRFDVLHAFPAVDNIASNRLCRKSGFELMGDELLPWAGRELHCNDWQLQLR